MDIPLWQYLVSMPLYIGILLILVELMRKYYKASTIFSDPGSLHVPIMV